MRGHHPDRWMSRSAAVGSVGRDTQRVDSSRERRVLRARVHGGAEPEAQDPLLFPDLTVLDNVAFGQVG